VSGKLLLSATELDGLLAGQKCLAVDCRFDFGDPARGRRDWLSGHIPGARYANLDTDLSSPIQAHSGRHPLPDSGRFAEYLAAIGWTPGMLLVAYDEGPNAVASRLWWLMRYFGQPSALLDGGLAAWTSAGLPLEQGEPDFEPAAVERLQPDREMIVTSRMVSDSLEDGSLCIVDARAGQRFTGEVETLDTRAGHIPGSLNRPFAANLRLNGRFKDAAELREDFEDLLEDHDRRRVAHSCGSGVTACHNLFAMELAGLTPGRLYAGSWSEWIQDPDRPIATGR
jgi:thiosulfate/3-mercaptopyruvate sulfurtransferase